MPHINVKRIFENDENELMNRLKQIDLKTNRTELTDIFEYISSEKELMERFGLLFLKYFLSLSFDTFSKLTYINTYYKNGIITQSIREFIFKFALNIRDTKEDQKDVTVYRLLYSILSQSCEKVFNPDSIQRYVDNTLIERNKQRVKEYDDIIENYIQNPAVYPPKLCNLDMDTTAKFALFNILYEPSLRPIEFEGMDEFKFSDNWTKLLKYARDSPGKTMFEIKTSNLESEFSNLNSECVSLEHMKGDIDYRMDEANVVLDFEDRKELEKAINEYSLSFKVAHPRFLTTLTYALNKFLCLSGSYASLSQNDVQDYLSSSSSAIWQKLYQSLLNDMAFELVDSENSYTYKKFVKTAACCFYYSRHHLFFPVSIWDNYYLQRSIFINSINLDNVNLLTKRNELKLIENITFTSIK